MSMPVPPKALVVHCPSCSAVPEPSRSSSAKGFSAPTGSEIFHQPAFQIHECPACALLFKHPTLSDADFVRYYNSVDFNKWEYPGFYPTERLAHEVLRSLPAGSSVLDYGCSTGRLLAPFVDTLKCSGVELDSRAAAIAQSKGIAILPPADIAGRQFDCIVMMDVFEHFTAPTEMMRRVVQALKPGGKLVVVSGNGDYPLCQADPAHFWYFQSVEHVCMLNRRHADYLQDALGLKLIGWTRCSHYDSTVVERLLQRVRYHARRAFLESGSFWKTIISHIPLVGRVAKWDSLPLVTLGKDHVVAVFQA